MDPYLLQNLEGLKRTFDGLTERLADLDLATVRKVVLTVSRKRAGLELILETFESWSALEMEPITTRRKA